MRYILLLLVLISCGEGPPTAKRQTADGYDVIELDGCEYIEIKYCLGCSGGYYSLTHKGNCKNSIHVCK
jgi:hypothetical protein